MNSLLSILAQEPAGAPQPGEPVQSMPFTLPFALMAGLLVFMLLSSRSQKKREKRTREDMYARLTKNDRVLTIGGIIGTVVSVKDDDVMLKVDESTNTKMTFRKSAIQHIIDAQREAAGDKK
jgi:preprotein translocase subunit YajC